MFDNNLYSLPRGMFMASLAANFTQLLEVTAVEPYSKHLYPYSAWIERSTVYLGSTRQLAPLQDLFIVAVSLLGMGERTLLRPAVLHLKRLFEGVS